jgi:hypothetical protein
MRQRSAGGLAPDVAARVTIFRGASCEGEKIVVMTFAAWRTGLHRCRRNRCNVIRRLFVGDAAFRFPASANLQKRRRARVSRAQLKNEPASLLGVATYYRKKVISVAMSRPGSASPPPADPPRPVDPYKVLGLTPSATEADIRAVYRKLALKTHPGKKTEQRKINFWSGPRLT